MNVRQTRLVKSLLLGASFVPFIVLLVRFAFGTLGGNPVQTAMLYTGDWTMRFLMLSLAVRPLSDLARRKSLLPFRRTLGLAALFYAALHFSVYLGLDYFFRLSAVLQEARKSPYIVVGFINFVVLVILGATSVKSWMRRLGERRWSGIHRLVYPVAIGGIVHYALKAKTASPELLCYAALVAALLAYRLLRKPLGLTGRDVSPPPGPASNILLHKQD